MINPLTLQQSSIVSTKLVGNIGTIAVTQSINPANQVPPGNTVIDVHTKDASVLSLVVTLVDADPTLQAAKIARIQWGAGGVSNLSTFVDVAHGRSFTVFASALRVSVGHYVVPAIAGGLRLGAFVTEGYSPNIPIGTQAPIGLAAGASVAVPILPFCNEVVFVPEAGSTWQIQFRRLDATVINTIVLAAGVLPPPIPLPGDCSDLNITNLGAIVNTLGMFQRIQF